MPPRLYLSTDPGAPVLQATAGSFINLLRACLVDGYGDKPPAGWSMPFAQGTPPTQAGFKQGPRAGYPQWTLYVDNTGSDAGLAGYEVLTGADQGTGRFPSPGTFGVWTRGRATTGWVLLADERTFYFFTPDTVNDRGFGPVWFGDFVSFKPDDQYACILVAPADSRPGWAIWNGLNMNYAMNSIGYGIVGARAYDGVTVAPSMGIHTDAAKCLYGPSGDPQLRAGVNPSDAKLWIAQIYVHEPDRVLRGYLRGLWAALSHRDSVADGLEFDGEGALAGRRFRWTRVGFYRQVGGNERAAAAYVFEISDTWDR